MISNTKLENYLNELLNAQSFSDYCPNGLQVEGNSNICKIAFAVSATIESITKAAEEKADALIVHHGILWDHQGAKKITGSHGKRIQLLIQNNINLYAYHLPLDGHPKLGNAAQIAQALKLKKLKPFAQFKNQFIGICGTFSPPITAGTLAILLEKKLNHSIISTAAKNQMIVSLGIVTGGANKYFDHALEYGLDAFLTGEISEHNWNDAKESKVAYFAGGHYATEQWGIWALQKNLKKKFNKIDSFYIPSLNPV